MGNVQAQIPLPVEEIAAFCQCWQIKVDIINRESIEQSRNYLRRRAILETARAIYAA